MRPEPRATRLEEAGRSVVRFRAPTLMMAVAVAGVWLGMLALPGVGPLIGVLLLGLLGVLAILAAAMGLGWIGFRLFAAFDRLACWSTRSPEWFHPDPIEDADQGR